MKLIKKLWRYRKTLSWRKCFNAMQCILSYHISRYLQSPRWIAGPLAVSIEPTTACNLRCPECPSGLRSFTRPTGNIKLDFYKKIIDQIQHSVFQVNFYFQGEPFIHQQFLEMVAYASSKKIYTMTSTNAHFLTEENCRGIINSGLDELIISVDGTTQEVYEQYRKEGDLSKVLIGAKSIVQQKKLMQSTKPHLVFQFLVVRPNEHQITEVYALADQIGINEVRLKTAQIYDYENGSNLIPEQALYSRYIKNNQGKFQIKNELLNQCWRMWQACVITWDGRVVPCCFDKDASHVLGNVQSHTFKQIWHGATYYDFRAKLLNSRSKIDICQNCTEGTKVFVDA